MERWRKSPCIIASTQSTIVYRRRGTPAWISSRSWLVKEQQYKSENSIGATTSRYQSDLKVYSIGFPSTGTEGMFTEINIPTDNTPWTLVSVLIKYNTVLWFSHVTVGDWFFHRWTIEVKNCYFHPGNYIPLFIFHEWRNWKVHGGFYPQVLLNYLCYRSVSFYITAKQVNIYLTLTVVLRIEKINCLVRVVNIKFL